MTTKKCQACQACVSEVLGLWVCKSAWTWNFPRSQEVKKSVVSTVLQKCQGMFPAWPTREKRKCRTLLEEFVTPFGFLIPKELLKIQARLSQRPSKNPVSQTGSPSCSSNLTNRQPMIMRVPTYQLSDLQGFLRDPLSLLNRERRGEKSSLHRLRNVDPALVFLQNSSCNTGAHDSENLGSEGMGRATCK